MSKILKFCNFFVCIILDRSRSPSCWSGSDSRLRLQTDKKVFWLGSATLEKRYSFHLTPFWKSNFVMYRCLFVERKLWFFSKKKYLNTYWYCRKNYFLIKLFLEVVSNLKNKTATALSKLLSPLMDFRWPDEARNQIVRESSFAKKSGQVSGRISGKAYPVSGRIPDIRPDTWYPAHPY